MDKPTDDWDQMFAARGGFDEAYTKLIAYARRELARYQSDFGGGLAVRQLDAREVVHSAIERLFSEEWDANEDVYLLLRRHIQNKVRSLSKSAGETRLVRISGRQETDAAYAETEDLFAESPRENAEIRDRTGFCKKVLMCVLSEAGEDQILCKLTEALIEGWRDPNDMCDLLEISRSEYDAAFGRLKRRFRKVFHRRNLEDEG